MLYKVFSATHNVTRAVALKGGLYWKKHVWTNHRQETHGFVGFFFFAFLLTKSNSKKIKGLFGLISELQLSTFRNKLVN